MLELQCALRLLPADAAVVVAPNHPWTGLKEPVDSPAMQNLEWRQVQAELIPQESPDHGCSRAR